LLGEKVRKRKHRWNTDDTDEAGIGGEFGKKESCIPCNARWGRPGSASVSLGGGERGKRFSRTSTAEQKEETGKQVNAIVRRLTER